MNKFNNTEGLDSPLVVHKKTDSSYQANAAELELNKTHEQKSNNTLERHRFKKEKKKKNYALPIVLIILIALCVVFALYFTGVIGDRNKEQINETTFITTTEKVTTIEEKYKDTIVIKGTYIFVNGFEVNGIDGLQSEIKYEEPSQTRFSIIKENADDNYLNYEILPVLTELGFYGEQTQVSVVVSTGLMAQAELLTQEVTQEITDDAEVTSAPSDESTTQQVEQLSEITD